MRLAAAVVRRRGVRLGAPVVVEPEPLYTHVAIGGAGCACGASQCATCTPGGCGGCGQASCLTCLPYPTYGPGGRATMAPGWAPPIGLLTDPALMRVALARGCITEIYSALTVLVAGAAAVDVRVQPSQGCFVAVARRIVVISHVDPQQRQRALFRREFLGDCPISCHQTDRPALSDFMDTDDCNWCPTREIDIGRETDNEDYHLQAEALDASASARVQVAIRGVCYPSAKCWRGWMLPGGRIVPTFTAAIAQAQPTSAAPVG